MRQAGLPSSSKPSLFMIGKNSRGHWVVQDQHHLCGGLFVTRVEALKFAMFESGNCPEAAIMVPGVMELDFNSKPNARDAVNAHVELQRAA